MDERKVSARRQRIKSRVSLIILITLALLLLLAVLFLAVERALGDDWLPPVPTVPLEGELGAQIRPGGIESVEGAVNRESRPPPPAERDLDLRGMLLDVPGRWSDQAGDAGIISA